MVFTIAFWIAAFLVDAFFCTPPQKAWLLDISGHCGDPIAMYVVLASTDLTIDIIVILLPMPIFWRLQLATAEKVSLTFIFGLGFLYVLLFTLDPISLYSAKHGVSSELLSHPSVSGFSLIWTLPT